MPLAVRAPLQIPYALAPEFPLSVAKGNLFVLASGQNLIGTSFLVGRNRRLVARIVGIARHAGHPLCVDLVVVGIYPRLRLICSDVVAAVVEIRQLARTMVVASVASPVDPVLLVLGIVLTSEAPIEIVTEIVILPELHLEELDHVMQVQTGPAIARPSLRRFDLLDRLVQVPAYSVLAPAVHVCFLCARTKVLTYI